MKIIITKIKVKIKLNKKIIVFLLGLALIGIISGAFLITKLSPNDKKIVLEYTEKFINNTKGNKIDYFTSFKNCIVTNLLLAMIIWVLGISVIGTPINVFLYFIKSFMIGFSIAAFVLNYKIKGLFFSIIYILPQIINLIIWIILMIYAIKFSYLLTNSIFKKKTVNFKTSFDNYLAILIIIILFLCISSVIESFLIPLIAKNIIKLLF